MVSLIFVVFQQQSPVFRTGAGGVGFSSSTTTMFRNLKQHMQQKMRTQMRRRAPRTDTVAIAPDGQTISEGG